MRLTVLRRIDRLLKQRVVVGCDGLSAGQRREERVGHRMKVTRDEFRNSGAQAVFA